MSVSLPANVTAFLTQVINDLTVGPSLDGNLGVLFGPGRNFCSVQDIANVLRLLAAATGNTGLLHNEISAIMSGKDPSTQQYVGQIGGNQYLIIDAFKKLIEYCGGTFPNGKTMFSGTALAGTDPRVIAVDVRGGKVRIDEFRGFVIDVNSVRAVVVSNTADGHVTVDRDLATRTGGESVVVSLAMDFLGNTAFPKTSAGGQPGDNARLALLITTAKNALTAFTPGSMTVSAPTTAHVGGADATFTVVFAGSAPTGNIVVPIVSSNPAHGTVSPASLTFTPGNYTTPQTVTVHAVAADAGLPVSVGPATGDVHYAGMSATATVVIAST